MSTYNKNLPKISDICWMKKDRTGRTDTITMPFGGVIPSAIPYIGWRQSSYAYSYQVQYKITGRLIPSKQLDTGSDYSRTDWKYMNPNWSGNVNTFNKCVTMDKQHRYYRYYSFAGKSLMTKGSYDKLGITVRVRSFNSKKKQHGAWVSKQIYIKCKPDVKIHKIVALADGGIQMYLNTGGWKRGNSKVILKDIRHEGAGEKQNKKNLTEEVGAIGTEEAKGYPYAEFAGSGFDTHFEQNEKIVLKNCVFRTCDGVDVSLDGTYTIDSVDADINEPKVSIYWNDDMGMRDVEITKKDTADDWDDVKAWMNCILPSGKEIRVDAAQQDGSDDTRRFFRFYPPLDSDLELCVGITNNLGGTFWRTYTATDHVNLRTIKSKGRIVINYTDGTDTQPDNGTFYGSKIAAMNYETDYSINATRPHEKELALGRKRPVAFLGEGLEKSINIKGNIDGTENGEYVTELYSTYEDWLEFQEQQGVVLARFPNGRMYTALCTNLSIEQVDEFDDSRTVNMTLEEIEV